MQAENEYREIIKDLLREFYYTFDDKAIKIFFNQDVKKRNWNLFNYLFIRKAIDMALDLGGNEREVCSKLLSTLTHECNFGNMDFGYAFDHLIWVYSFTNMAYPCVYRITTSRRLMCHSSKSWLLCSLPEPSMMELSLTDISLMLKSLK